MSESARLPAEPMSVSHLKSAWENLGREDPLWAILSDPTKQHRGWDIAEFMATGRVQIDGFAGLLKEHGLSFGERVLDFGCGVGRLTNALAEQAAEAVGVDIAESMIEQAERLNQYPGRVRFLSYDGTALPFADASFDSAISIIVLQHVRHPVQIACLLELQRVVRPGGTLVVQIPSPKPDMPTTHRLDPPRSEVPADGDLTAMVEMHGLPTEFVRLLFRHCGSELVAAVPDDLAGAGWDSFTYLVRPGAAA